MKRLAIIGAGDMGKQIRHIASLGNAYEFVGFFDDLVDSGDVLGKIDDVRLCFDSRKFDALIVGIGYRHMGFRKEVFDRFKGEIPMARVIHPNARIDHSVHIDAGSVIYSGCTLDMGVKVGENVSINAGCVIAHDSSIGDHSMLSPGVVLSGFVKVEEMVRLGTSTTVIDNIQINSGIQTGAGAVVTEMLVDRGLYVGVPAKLKKAL